MTSGASLMNDNRFFSIRELMKQHVLRIHARVVKFERLVAAVRQNGLRSGWLQWRPQAEESLEGLSDGLAEAAGLDVLRAVTVTRGHSVAVKPRQGPAVLQDVLRQHFRGCALVLVEGEVPVPHLEWVAEGWQVRDAEGTAWRGSTEQLVKRLRSPRPWRNPRRTRRRQEA